MPSYQNSRICNNNHIEGATITAPEDVSYPAINMYDLKNRNKLYKPGTNSFTIELDFHTNSTHITFFSMLGASDSLFTVSNLATITLKASSINLFDGSEPVSVSVPVQELGAYYNFANASNTGGINYRYWQIVVDDSFNPDPIEIAYIYLGDHVIMDRNLSNGFTFVNSDNSLIVRSDNGKIFTRRRPERTLINSVSHRVMTRDDKDNILQAFRRVGRHTPFLFVIDPDECRDDFDFSVRAVYFNTIPNIRHQFRDFYSISYSLSEVI